MRNENAQYFFIFALFSVLGSFPEGKPTTEPRKATNSQACLSDPPCHVEVNGKNLTISLNATKSSDYYGACTETCLGKIACLEKNSMSAKCVNESSTAASCNKNNLDMEYKQTLDGMFTVRVTGLKEQFRNWSRVYIRAAMQGLSSDHLCVYIYNESAAATTAPANSTVTPSSKPDPEEVNRSNQTDLTQKPTSNLSPAGTATTKLTVTSSKPDTVATTAPANSTATPSSKPDPEGDHDKYEVLYIVLSVILVVGVIAAVFAWQCKKRLIQRQSTSSSQNSKDVEESRL